MRGCTWREEARGKQEEGERAMRHRTGLLILAIVVVAVLALGGTVGTMALTHSGFMRNGSGMMSRQQGYQGMMGGQYSHGSMMGGYGVPVAIGQKPTLSLEDRWLT
jgi:hypothetical protein